MFDDLANINVFMTVMAIIGGLGQLIFLANYFISIYRGEKATQNPWKSNTLEWTTPVEHIHGNWPGAIPEVHRWAYDYSKTDENGEYLHGQDFVLQTTPLLEGEEAS